MQYHKKEVYSCTGYTLVAPGKSVISNLCSVKTTKSKIQFNSYLLEDKATKKNRFVSANMLKLKRVGRRNFLFYV